MIQNADDAGAKTVWFYVDERQHGSSNLPRPDLANFQGPALVAANDACFTDRDWEGIQSLQQSIKADDPFKVGRFGIGFNSVYHLTGDHSILRHSFLFSVHVENPIQLYRSSYNIILHLQFEHADSTLWC